MTAEIEDQILPSHQPRPVNLHQLLHFVCRAHDSTATVAVVVGCGVVVVVVVLSASIPFFRRGEVGVDTTPASSRWSLGANGVLIH